MTQSDTAKMLLLFLLLPLSGSSLAASSTSITTTTTLTERNLLATAGSRPGAVLELDDQGRAVLARASSSSSSSSSSSTPSRRPRGLGVRAALRKTFLPTGFPSSVPEEYAAFQRYHVAQDLATKLRDTLAMQRVLTGLGVGSADATAAGAITSWLIRDGSGMVSSLLFTSLNSDVFGADVRRWRFFADAIVDLGILSEMVAGSFFAVSSGVHVSGGGLLRNHRQLMFLALLCFGSVCKALCGVAAGSANSAITLHWAQGGKDKGVASDISEIAAKGGAIGTISGLVGLVLSLFLARLTTQGGGLGGGRPLTSNAWFWFWLLTAGHLWSCRCGLRLLALRTLTVPRLSTLLDGFQATTTSGGGGGSGSGSGSSDGNGGSSGDGFVPTPASLAATERVVAWPASMPRVKMGVSLQRLLPLLPPQTASGGGGGAAASEGEGGTTTGHGLGPSLVSRFEGEAFLPVLERKRRRWGRGTRWSRCFGASDNRPATAAASVLLLLKEGASEADELRAATYCLLLLRLDRAGDADNEFGDEAAAAAALEELHGMYPAFLAALSRGGWVGGDLHGDQRLLSGPWRISIAPTTLACCD